MSIDQEIRTLDTDKMSARTFDDGRFQQVVEHASLAAATQAMCP